MAEGTTDKLSLLNWPTLLLFVLVSWGIVLLPPPMKSLRPSGEPESIASRSAGQIFEARLWQDPFDVLRAAQANKEKPPCAEQALIKGKETGKRTLILPVMLPGNDYPEEVETRLRSRYAVVSALGVSGYVPVDGGDLRCFSNPWPARSPVAVEWPVFPFEWYSLVPPVAADVFPQDDLRVLTRIAQRGLSPDDVAVIWVDERIFDADRTGVHPAILLRQWAETLKQKLQASVAFLGPQFSNTLRSMLIDPDRAGQGARGGNKEEKFKIYSFASTVEALRHPPPRTMLSDSFEVVHVIGTDLGLAEALACELKLRGIDPTTDGSSIALVAEWDTYYSQSMFNVFGTAFKKGLWHFTYQQGIDGRLSKDRAGNASGVQKGATSNGESLPGGEPMVTTPVVQSFGRSQIDYLQRLVDQMKRTGGDRWAAIGVLGTDFYDKILVLEALKHEFPEAIFFTTDMDQRYLDPAEHRTTRNLLVASHFGLELHQGLQRAIPPFRSAYQTSLFLGCLKALRDQGVPAPNGVSDAGSRSVPGGNDRCLSRRKKVEFDDPMSFAWRVGASSDRDTKPKPMIFEIGLNRAYPLTSPVPEGIHPTAYQRSPTLNSLQILGLAALPASSILLGLALWPPLRNMKRFDSWLLLGTCGLSIAMVIVALWDHLRPHGEPFGLLEGISTWPTAFLRLGGAIFCVFALIRAHRTFEENSLDLSRRYGLDLAETPAPLRSWSERSREWPGDERIAQITKLDESLDPSLAWALYRRLKQPTHSFPRVTSQVLRCLPFIVGLLLLFGLPNEPYRGYVNRWTNIAVRVAAIILTVYFFWFVIDATCLCIRLIQVFIGKETRWPESVLERSAATLGVDPGRLQSGGPAATDPVKYSLEQYTDVSFLADHTVSIERLNYDVAFAYLLLFLARSPFFDQYAMSWFLISVYTVALLGVFCCGAGLRYAARQARRQAQEKIREQINCLRRVHSQSDVGQAGAGTRRTKTLVRIARAIGDVRTGAFSPLTDDPILRTIVMILGGVGAVLSLEPIRQFLR
jgi:hypothetical protein